MPKFIIEYPVHPDRFNPNSVADKVALIAAFKRARPAEPVIYYGPDGGLFEAGGQERDLSKLSDFELYKTEAEKESGPSFVGVPEGE